MAALTFKEAPNYEMPADSNKDNVYMVTGGCHRHWRRRQEQDDRRCVPWSSPSPTLEEDGTVTLTSVQPKIGFPLTASVTDLDGGEMGITWQWERDNTGDGRHSYFSMLFTTPMMLGKMPILPGMGAKTDTYTPDRQRRRGQVSAGDGDVHRRQGL